MVKLFFLGRPYIEVDGMEIQLSRRKNLALLAYLALANEPRRREELIALLWPELDAYHAQTALRRDLWVLKTALVESVLVATPHTVGLSASGGLWCDVNAFQQLLATALQTAHKPQVNEEEIAPLVSAVQLYRDDFLRGFSLRDSPPFDEWQVAQTEALRHQLTLALGALVAAYAQQAQPDLAITYAQRLVEIDPFHEAAHAQLMRLYAEGGRVGAALQQFESYARLLTENFDLPPSAEMSRLHAEIQARLGQGLQTIALHLNSGDVKALHTQGSSVPSVAELVTASTHHLPTPATPFVGRAQEVAQLMHLLAEPTCRLITVLGPGGVGKSRLAIETAVRRQRNYADGVYFVSLAALRHPQLLPAALLEALGVMRETDRTPEETLTASLQQRQLLLILDNFEHLLAATPVLLRLLADTTELQLLVTSRTRLNVPAEWLYALEGMSYPVAVEQTVTTVTHAADESLTSHDYALSPRYDAVDLFRQCAQRIAPSVSWSTVEEAAVVEVCRLVEGIPLAIELAAAWLPVMPVAAIVVQLQQGLDLLVTQQTAVVERHRSMHAALEYSWQLATPAEQIALAQLAVFHGGFLPSFAQAVADADPIMLRTLTDKSWLHRRATGRLELHELIRQFCAEKLMGSAFDLQRICTRHAQAYANFLQDRFVELRDWRQVDAVQAVVAELDNLRAAWAHAVAVRALELLHELVESIYRVGLIRNWHRELIELFQATVTTLTHTEPRAGVVAAQQQTPATEFFLARLHARLARYLVDLGQYEEAAIHADTALALLDRGGPELATKPAWLQERSLIFAVHSSVLNNVGPLPVALAKVQETYRLLARLPQGVDSSEILVLTTRVEGECRFAQGDQSAVIVQLSKLAAQLRNQGEMWLRSQILALLVYFLRVKNDTVLTHQYTTERLAICRVLGDQRGIAYCLADLGYNALFCDLPDPAAAQQYFDEMAVVSDLLGHPSVRADLWFGLAQVAYFKEDWDAARHYLAENLAIVDAGHNQREVTLVHLWLGEVALAEGALREAQRRFSTVLQQASEMSNIPVMLLGLEGLAKTVLRQGLVAQALPILALAQHHPSTWEFARSRIERLLTELAAELPEEQMMAALVRGKALPLDEAVVWGQQLK